MTTLYLAPVGTGPEDRAEFHPVGFTHGDTLEFDTANEAVTDFDGTRRITATETIRFDASKLEPAVHEALFGKPATSYFVRMSAAVPPAWVTYPPRKGYGCTGKRYRAARRAHGRRLRAWKRAGSPQDTRLWFLPQANVEFR